MDGGLIVNELGGGVGGDGRREEVALAEQASKFFEGFALRGFLAIVGMNLLESQSAREFRGRVSKNLRVGYRGGALLH
jgi:hypothetical protein